MSTILAFNELRTSSICYDILMASETKLGSSFTNAQFVIEEYIPPFRYD